MSSLADSPPRSKWSWRFAGAALAGSCAVLAGGCTAAVETEPLADRAGAGGHAAAGGADAMGFPPIAPPDVGCEVEAVLLDHCGPGCHSPGVRRAGLDLSYDSGLVGRIKDIPATHREIACNPPTEAFRECLPPNEPAACIPFAKARLVDSAHVEESWLLKKVNGTHGGCGLKMPAVPTGYGGWAHDCLQAFVRAVAALPR
jgi:hypothetical protein